MNDDSKVVYALLRGVLEKWIDGCECGGSGAIQVQVMREGGYTVSADMASDACMPEIEGMFMSEPEPDVDIEPCPTCTPWRELVKELCWHESERIHNAHPSTACKHCGAHKGHVNSFDFPYCPSNPNLTTAMEGSRLLIVDLMDRAGMQEGFLLFNEKHSYCRISKRDKSGALRWAMRESDEAWEYCKAEILTDGKYLVPAIRGYLEGRV